MEEIEYKLKTNTSVLIVNAIDKLIFTIKSKYKPAERQKFVLENEELKFLREKCLSQDPVVSLSACQGLLALVELNVLEIGHTMSTIVSLLPSTHNFSAIISTMAGLLILDLKSRLVPGQPYKCQFSLRSPQHPFITVLEKNKDMEEDVLAQMHALCTNHEYLVSSNSLELLRSVFLWMTCNPQRERASPRAWQLLLSLSHSEAQSSLLLACISCQQICNPKLMDSAFNAYSWVTESAIYQQRKEYVVAFVPMLARISSLMIRHGRDPRPAYSLIERCFSVEAGELVAVSGLTLLTLADGLTHTSALYLHELFNLCLNIISKHEYSTLGLNAFVGMSLQWLHLPSYLTTNALNVASTILDIQQTKSDNNLYTANLKQNRTFQNLIHTDAHLHSYYKLLGTWERARDNPAMLRDWFERLTNCNDSLKVDVLPFLVGLCLDRSAEESLIVEAIRCLVGIVGVAKEVSVTVLPILVYKIANDERPSVRLECLKGLPLMAATKENVPTIVSILSKLKANNGAPSSLLISLYTSLAETQVRCFPYLQELLVDATSRPDDLKWEVDIAKALAVKRICEARASSHGLELVSVISSLLNRCTDKSGATATSLTLEALGALWRGNAVAPPGTWRALEPRLGKDSRPGVQVSLCNLLGEIPALRVSTPAYDTLVTDAARRLWGLLGGSGGCVSDAAARALAAYRLDDYRLADVPESYRRTVKLPASYCKTPADATRNPEDVLDYIPCEIWPEVFKNTPNALPGIQYLVSKLMERETKSYRSGVYMLEGREPQTLSLPPHSVVKGMLEYLRRQITAPTYDIPEAALLALLDTVASEFPRPLPPVDLSFLHEAGHRGPSWRPAAMRLAARQALTAPSAKRLAENFLIGIEPGVTEESDIMLVFEALPILARTMPPNNLRPTVERCLADSFSRPAVYSKQLELIQLALENERIHEANRTWICQLVEGQFSLISDDSPLWPVYVRTCVALSTKYLERMTSPSSWWEVSSDLLRKGTSIRSELAARTDCAAPLVWLNESVDVHATQIIEQEYSLRCIQKPLRAARPDAPATRDWFLQLMARTQVAFNEMEDESSKLYLCDVFMLSAIVFSGIWSFEPDLCTLHSRTVLQDLLPSALSVLMAREAWDCSLQVLEWLCHTRVALRDAHDAGAAAACQRGLVALRHCEHLVTHKIWMKLEHQFVPTTTAFED